ncbi:hypothetical protein [Streptomyces sp. NBC_00503]|uniref:hypothetical protein n=1 Tax=Streptomyces sp. NBC_00503 TaxID=2903659 RepID=UPI002E820E62|nr:hypothetical protein [Streptomyces sp. NBC_00503]WUD81936.1 hypothetical protein OG490_16080 [Streptomyces sp. NBC_00503]
MTSRTNRNCAHGVRSIDTPDDPHGLGLAEVAEPSADLLDRAQAGWARFTGMDGDESDA